MSNLSNISITHTFNGDIAAADKVNAAQLDTQLSNLATSQNATKAALDSITDGANNLASQTVGLSQLKPEVAMSIPSGVAVSAEMVPVVGASPLASARAAMGVMGIADIVYGQIYVSDGVTAQSIPTGASTYTKITAFNTAQGHNGLSSNCTVDKANSQVVDVLSGVYIISFQMSYTSGTNNVVWQIAAFANGVELNQVHDSDKNGIGTDVASFSSDGIVALTAGVAVDLRLKHDNGGSVNITPIFASISLRRIA